MKIRVQQWAVSRKKVRPSFSLGALGLLFSISDRVSGPKLSEQDRLDITYPYRLELSPDTACSGSFRLEPSGCSVPDWARTLGGRVWRAEQTRAGVRLSTDLTEYERLIWEEQSATAPPTLAFVPLQPSP